MFYCTCTGLKQNTKLAKCRSNLDAVKLSPNCNTLPQNFSLFPLQDGKKSNYTYSLLQIPIIRKKSCANVRLGVTAVRRSPMEQGRIIYFKDKFGNVREHLHKPSATFPFKFYQFLPVFIFLTVTDQEQALKTYLPLDAPARKNHTELGQSSEVATRTQHIV